MALSGGVDSAVSAALLQREGYDVRAVFVKVWQPDFLDCTQEDDRKSAKRVAASLGIPFEVLDGADAYKRHVVDVMTRGYAEGQTPNPDILCNQFIKFGILAEYAQSIQANCIATGHYARTKTYGDAVCLQKAVDSAKDQVYFLSQVNPQILARCLFPVGGFTKEKTRTLAKKMNLPVFDKKDSQGLCFMGMVDMAEFLAHAVPLKNGDVLDTSGACIGTHTGAQQFTTGQRHGFTLHIASTKPHYVLGVDVTKNTITVDTELERGLTELKLTSVVRFAPELKSRVYDVQVRYHGNLVKGSLSDVNSTSVHVALQKPHHVAKGQVAVIYDKDVLVMSGIVS